MRLNSAKIAAIITITIVLVLAFAGVAVAAPPWSDASNSWWTSSYSVTEAQVATVADGYPDGTFRPNTAVTRGQFAKMAVNGLGVETSNPSTPSFKDVARGGTFYIYVEGAYKAGLIGGYPGAAGLLFKPSNTITRQQANSILGRYLSKLELNNTGSIHGDVSNYGSLDLWYAAEGKFYLNGFTDANKVVADHRATTAYLIRRGIVKGSNDKLSPISTLVRSQAGVMVLRVKAEAQAILTPPTPPTNLAVVSTGQGVQVFSTGTTSYAGNDPTPQVSGSTLADSDVAIYDEPFYGTTYVKLGTSNASGAFYANLDDAAKPLGDGTHSFTAKVKNENGLVSPASAPVTYVLDTTGPEGSITAPALLPGEAYAATSAKPTFSVTAGDAASGVKNVEFQVAAEATPTSWTTIALHTNTSPVTAQNTYTAVWPAAGALKDGLTDGTYLLRAVLEDLVGNRRTVGTLQIKVDAGLPTATITAPLPTTGAIAFSESGSPAFTSTATDLVTGVTKVEFFYWKDPAPSGTTAGPTAWSGFTLLSTDTTAPYEASYAGLPGAVLPTGRYIFAVRATDKAGNQSALLGTSGYVAGATQVVVIGPTAPIIAFTKPSPGQAVPDDTPFPVEWTVQAVVAGTLTIEFSPTGGDPWTTIAAGVAFPASSTWDSRSWAVPNITGADITTYRIRITAQDTAGHVTIATSSPFTVYDSPAGVTGLTASDPDNAEAGIDGRDFGATWILSSSLHVSSQKVYLLPDGQTLGEVTDTPVASLASGAATWTGTSSIVNDSRGATLVDGDYRLWIVVTDPAGRTAQTSSDPFPVAAP
ncbi:MAG: S-layer homology domain-containing protein [Thermoleophilia bacterium]|nr:S-layer homology domain-containing protein [Thermoleophilia bacterium]